MKKECEESYRQVMDYLCRLLEFGFPKSYSIEFRSSNKSYLPIKKLPKKGINQLFANAMLYPNLYDRIEKYARLAMKEFEWYNNLKDEFCAMPGTFAVFGLGLIDEKYHQLARDYLSICDGEHQSLQGNFALQNSSNLSSAADNSAPQSSVESLSLCDVVGPICESGDFLAKGVSLPSLQSGDLLAIKSAGAYGFSMSSNYNTRCRAAESAVYDGQDRLIRKRESFDELIALEKDFV